MFFLLLARTHASTGTRTRVSGKFDIWESSRKKRWEVTSLLEKTFSCQLFNLGQAAVVQFVIIMMQSPCIDSDPLSD